MNSLAHQIVNIVNDPNVQNYNCVGKVIPKDAHALVVRTFLNGLNKFYGVTQTLKYYLNNAIYLAHEIKTDGDTKESDYNALKQTKEIIEKKICFLEKKFATIKNDDIKDEIEKENQMYDRVKDKLDKCSVITVKSNIDKKLYENVKYIMNIMFKGNGESFELFNKANELAEEQYIKRRENEKKGKLGFKTSEPVLQTTTKHRFIEEENATEYVPPHLINTNGKKQFGRFNDYSNDRQNTRHDNRYERHDNRQNTRYNTRYDTRRDNKYEKKERNVTFSQSDFPTLSSLIESKITEFEKNEKEPDSVKKNVNIKEEKETIKSVWGSMPTAIFSDEGVDNMDIKKKHSNLIALKKKNDIETFEFDFYKDIYGAKPSIKKAEPQKEEKYEDNAEEDNEECNENGDGWTDVKYRKY
jgi:hypothetical protein